MRIDGVRACSTDPERWTDAYRTGVIEGLFINHDNQIDAYPAASADCAAELLQHHSDAAGVLTQLHRLLQAALLVVPVPGTARRCCAVHA